MSRPDVAVRLSDISGCFEGIIPAAICTVAEDGTPNVTYLSVVHRIDDAHVALSRQFFNKTDRNTVVNPYAQVHVIEPETGRAFLLDLVYERTETSGPLFERMRTKLEAVAAQDGMAAVFRLRGTDVCRVEACIAIPGGPSEESDRRDVKLERIEEYSRQLAEVDDLEELLVVVQRACVELLNCPHSFVMVVDESGQRLYTVTSTGFPASGAGSEVRIGDGLIGVAAARRQSVRVTHMGRERSYSQAVRVSMGDTTPVPTERIIPLPRIPSVQSQLVTPMLAHHQLTGVLCLQSPEPGAFQSADECVAGILANQAAMAMVALGATANAGNAGPSMSSVQIKHYQEDDSIFLDNEYLIKGVAGGILWRLLKDYQEQGRIEFSNREIRLDQTLALPDIKDNLEARLILLRKRLEERCDYLRIQKTSRGRFTLHVGRPVMLVHVEGGSPV